MYIYFNLVLEYPFSPLSPSSPFSPKFYHIDTWRLLNPEELKDLGLKQMLKPGNVIAIEWADKIQKSELRSQKLVIIQVKFEHKSETQRVIRISSLSSLSS